MIIAERLDLRLFPRTFHAEDHKENPPTELVLCSRSLEHTIRCWLAVEAWHFFAPKFMAYFEQLTHAAKTQPQWLLINWDSEPSWRPKSTTALLMRRRTLLHYGPLNFEMWKWIIQHTCLPTDWFQSINKFILL